LWLHDLLQSLFWVGFTLGLLACGRISDARGRKWVYVWTQLLLVGGLLASAFAPTFFTLAVSRLVVGAACGGGGLAGYVLAFEWQSTRTGRGLVGTCVLNFFYVSGELLNVALALNRGWGADGDGSADSGGQMLWWRGLTLAVAVLAAVLVLPSVAVATESPRWLVEAGRESEATALLKDAARAAGLSENAVPQLRPPAAAQDRGAAPTYAELVRDAPARQMTAAMCFLWFATSFSYFGLNQAAANIIPPNFDRYAGVAAMAFVENPANFLGYLAAGRVGKVNACAYPAAFGGTCCILASLAGGGLSQALFGLAGKFGATVVFAIMYVKEGAAAAALLLRPRDNCDCCCSSSCCCGDYGAIAAILLLLLLLHY